MEETVKLSDSIIASGCTKHMFRSKRSFKMFTDIEGFLQTGNKKRYQVTRMGVN